MNTRAASTVPSSPAPQPAWNFFADFGRQQLSVATDASCAMLRGFQAMRKIQEEAAQQATARQQAAAEKLHTSCQPTDLLALQAGLLRDEVESAAHYWQELAATALEMQTEMMGCASHLVDSDAALEAASALESFDMIPGVTGLFPLKPRGGARRAGDR